VDVKTISTTTSSMLDNKTLNLGMQINVPWPINSIWYRIVTLCVDVLGPGAKMTCHICPSNGSLIFMSLTNTFQCWLCHHPTSPIQHVLRCYWAFGLWGWIHDRWGNVYADETLGMKFWMSINST
jgi:hypothetical protein